MTELTREQMIKWLNASSGTMEDEDQLYIDAILCELQKTDERTRRSWRRRLTTNREET